MAGKNGLLGRVFGGRSSTPQPSTPQPSTPEPSLAPETTPPPTDQSAQQTPRPSWFKRMKSGLARSSGALSEGITGIFTKRKLDDEALQDLEDALLRADLGLDTAIAITDALRAGRYNKEITPGEVRDVLAAEISRVLTPVAVPLAIDTSHRPHVILMVGVNGTGKTTTIGKMAAKFRAEGRSVMIAAGDTFRAAAVEQLRVWADRAGAGFIARESGSDAAGLAFDALREAKQSGTDVLLIDTAGRLQNKDALMAELEKIVRVIGKVDDTAPHTVLQTLDATTGQNAISQVEVFARRAGVNGLIMTKLDGTARGGILVALASKFSLPVHYIGIGEQIDDLEPFAAEDFARALAGIDEPSQDTPRQ
jgi:fused signal recognition particle receptor